MENKVKKALAIIARIADVAAAAFVLAIVKALRVPWLTEALIVVSAVVIYVIQEDLRKKVIGEGSLAASVVLAQYVPSHIAQQFADAIRQIITEVVDFVTPIINVIGAAMIVIGLILVAARQEFYGLRLIIGGGVTLIFMNIIIPVILSFL